MTHRPIEYIACPICKGPLELIENERCEYVCTRCALAFEVRNDIPVMIPDAARRLPPDEVERIKAHVSAKAEASR